MAWWSSRHRRARTPARTTRRARWPRRSCCTHSQPLVYEPGPLQTNDENAWKLKSSTAILDLKVADIAAGSGAFLVAAARYLADRVTEAWIDEGLVSAEEQANPQLAKERAIREVVARCLYGADINPMAVEMCKLSLWLVSMDQTKPFSFVDDKIFCGNSLLGVTTLDQLRYLHIDPDTEAEWTCQLLVDVDGKIAEATRLRKELASPVDEHDPMRSTRGQAALLEQFERGHRGAAADRRRHHRGRPAAGRQARRATRRRLQGTQWELAEAFPGDGSAVRGVVDADGIALTDRAGAPLARWKALRAELDNAQPLERKVALGAVRFQGLQLALTRDAQGGLNVARLAGPERRARGGALARRRGMAGRRARPCSSLDARVSWADATTRPETALALEAIDARIGPAQWPSKQPATLTLQGRLSGGAAGTAPATLHLAGDAGARQAKLTLRADEVALAAFGPYLAALFTPRVEGRSRARCHARLGRAAGRARGGRQAGGVDALARRRWGEPPQITRGGGRRVRAMPRSWKRLEVAGMQLDITNRKLLSIGRVGLQEPRVAVERARDGSINVLEVAAGAIGRCRCPCPRQPRHGG